MKQIAYTLVLGFSLCSYHATTHCFTFTSAKTAEGYLHSHFIKELVETFHPDFFLETGTYNGLNAATVAPHFKEVHTVELGDNLYKEAHKRLSSIKNVTLYLGHSSEMIRAVAPTLQGHILFWLDAHYSGEGTALSNDNSSDPDSVTAIRTELQAIKESGIKDCTILIDDIRGFGTVINSVEYLGCWAYPSIQEICEVVKEINPHFSFALIGDILMIYDQTKYTPILSPTIVACTESRLYNGSNLTDNQLIAHEEIIMNASSNEQVFIADLYNRMTGCKDPMFHHDLWYGLVCMGTGNWRDALAALEKVPTRVEFLTNRRERTSKIIEYKHWRINQYLLTIKENINLVR